VFIRNREQCVLFDNCLSSVTGVVSGVPQGSGPFLVFNNFIFCFTYTCIGQAKLADDVKLYLFVNVFVLYCMYLHKTT